jgi:4-amino-4-deoxy-L-arabinose transferase-like glycosyltransferase
MASKWASALTGLLARGRRALASWVDGGSAMGQPLTRIEVVATACLVALGLLFRARGMIFGERLELWNDEASWAMRMFERPLSEHLIRPPLFVILTRASATLFDYRELGFRLLPWLAGMATPFVALALSRRFLRVPAARILFVATLSLSASAIDFSKEFKQYAVGLLLQLLLPYMALRWMDSRATRDLWLACALAPFGVLFSQDVMFLYPGLFLAMAIEAWRVRSTKQLLVIVGMGAGTAALVLSMFFLLWRRIPKDVAEQHWGGRYDVFYLDGGKAKGKEQGSQAAWLAGKYRDMSAMPGSRRDTWSNDGALSGDKLAVANEVDVWLWVGLHVVGLGVLLWTRRVRELLLFWSPLLVCFALNLAGRWPIGAFRTNLFVLAGTSAIAACAFELMKPRAGRLSVLVPTLALIGLPIALFQRDFHGKKPGAYAAGVHYLLKTLSRERGSGGGRERLYMDTQACQPFKYYTTYHPSGKRLWKELEPKIEPVCGRQTKRLVTLATKLKRKQRAWLLFLNRASIPRKLKVLSRTQRYKHTLIAVRRK